nr:PREDICTED: C-C motif chemokine 18-like [Latimeria chalumnae]|eukprot:XP_005995565.1 PREDICTED: C-C motif chemokine 18-like [Latimeria chalumnae]
MKSLVVFVCISVLVVCSVAGTAGPGPKLCCPQLTSIRIPPKRVRTYSELEGNGSCLEAVVLYTKKGKEICADPKKKWVKNIIAILKQRQQQEKMKCPEKKTTMATTTLTPRF